MKILFLDIDGVVNTGRNLLWLPSDMHHEFGSFKEHIDQTAAHAVRYLCEYTGCKVVINSTHGGYGEDHIRDMFMKVGYDISEDLYINWCSGFPNDNMNREESVLNFLEELKEAEQEVEAWCVIDDADLPKLSDHHVQPKSQNGIMMEDFEKACKILGKPLTGVILI